jgi:hypothetical protein
MWMELVYKQIFCISLDLDGTRQEFFAIHDVIFLLLDVP